ncbi:LuxR C-terminal-related transcriptional regulator [Serratia aquatilis]|uniref:LuxR C-terminal-related transcriptional regulator n=1 Tax=Serratia aquatilis TaxID=1737515 RepID=A0ABV6ED76_9GAMM
MEKIVILSDCIFTRSGLETLLRPEAYIFSTSSFKQCKSYLIQQQDGDIDLIVLSIRYGGIDALVQLASLLRCYHPSCKVLLDPGSASIPMLCFYLDCLNAKTGLIDLTLPLPKLKWFITRVICGQVVLSTRDLLGLKRLTVRERTVLLGLMKELCADDIARTLMLSIKTISYYKRSGLCKLGARNFQDLLLPVVKRYPRGYSSIQPRSASYVQECQYALTA